MGLISLNRFKHKKIKLLNKFNLPNINVLNIYFNKNLFNINFLRKERIYTKLKYSRVPQYDIVSGGAAALLAGFLGFLIAEKFGFELLDSGDFYFLFMYIVFFFFFLKLLNKLIYKDNKDLLLYSFLSFKFLFYYFINIFNVFKNKINSFLK